MKAKTIQATPDKCLVCKYKERCPLEAKGIWRGTDEVFYCPRYTKHRDPDYYLFVNEARRKKLSRVHLN